MIRIRLFHYYCIVVIKLYGHIAFSIIWLNYSIFWTCCCVLQKNYLNSIKSQFSTSASIPFSGMYCSFQNPFFIIWNEFNFCRKPVEFPICFCMFDVHLLKSAALLALKINFFLQEFGSRLLFINKKLPKDEFIRSLLQRHINLLEVDCSKRLQPILIIHFIIREDPVLQITMLCLPSPLNIPALLL